MRRIILYTATWRDFEAASGRKAITSISLHERHFRPCYENKFSTELAPHKTPAGLYSHEDQHLLNSRAARSTPRGSLSFPLRFVCEQIPLGLRLCAFVAIPFSMVAITVPTFLQPGIVVISTSYLHCARGQGQCWQITRIVPPKFRWYKPVCHTVCGW